MEAASRRAERESQRHYRELQRNAKEQAKLEVLQRAGYEVEVFENQLERLTSVHKEAPDAWNWNSICNTPPPLPPERSSAREVAATAALNAYSPGFMDKLLGRTDAKRQALVQVVESAFAQDEQVYQKAYQDYCQRHNDWNERRQLAGSILLGDTQAYTDALVDFNPFADISELGAAIEFKPHNAQLVEIRLTADGDRLIPDQIKSLSSAGKLSTKAMPKGQFYQIYLDFVCGVALRAGRELFAFLPVQLVLVNIQANLLNTRTGHQGLETILTVAMSRAVFEPLNFNHIDPSDAMENFPHRMDFRKTAGFGPVEPFDFAESLAPKPPEQPMERGLEPHTPTSPLPARNEFESALTTEALEDGCYWIRAGKAASLVGISKETKLTLAVSRRIAEAVEEAGYSIEPDARFGGGSYDWTQFIGIFKLEEQAIAPSVAYQGAANLLRLCVLVAAADGMIDKNELGIFRQIIESQIHFSQIELKRLTILERILVHDTEVATKTLTRVAKAIPIDKRMLVGQVLVKVAAVDHVITKSEFRALERVFKTFELPAQKLSDLMLQVCPSPEETTVQEAKAGSIGERIPAAETSAGFALNMSKVYAITNETKEVVGILSVVMQDEEEEVPRTPKNMGSACPLLTSINESPPSEKVALLAKFIGLDPAFQPVLERLLAKTTWPRSEFHALAGEFHLMPLSIHDVINEWADESLGDFLLEGEDPVLIRRELIQKEKT